MVNWRRSMGSVGGWGGVGWWRASKAEREMTLMSTSKRGSGTSGGGTKRMSYVVATHGSLDMRFFDRHKATVH